jgi:redox-sensitive bicupin YhaK (pirin superfamily)
MGSLRGEESKAVIYSPLVCAELCVVAGQTQLQINRDFEHGLLVTEGEIIANGERVLPGNLAYEPSGSSVLHIDTPRGSRILLIGGEPFDEDLLMWWNFVGRSHDEIAAAREDWEAGRRFGEVVEDDHPVLPAPELPSIRLLPRPSRRVRT